MSGEKNNNKNNKTLSFKDRSSSLYLNLSSDRYIMNNFNGPQMIEILTRTKLNIKDIREMLIDYVHKMNNSYKARYLVGKSNNFFD